MEFKSIAVADIKTSERIIIGYAAAFNNEDKIKDIIEPGAFKKTIKERGIKVFYNHSTPIGLPVLMQEDSKGLHTESKISATAKGDEILQLAADGVLTEMSIAYDKIRYTMDEKTGIRRLKELKLYEYGPVDFAANEAAVITGVKALTDRLASGQPINSDHLARVRGELKSLLDALDHATGEPGKPTPDAGPSIDTRILKLSEEMTARLAWAFRLQH